MNHRYALVVLSFLLLSFSGCTSSRKEVRVFAAASLARAFAELEERFEETHPRMDIMLEVGGSQEICRKVAELGRRADVVAVADYQVIDAILRPAHASANVRFATNALTLVHLEHSKYTEEISAANWPEVLLRPGVRLGLVEPDQAPVGYRTLLAWALTELAGRPGLAARLRASVRQEHRAPHESELLQLLQSRAIDYAFVYESSAEDHNLKTVPLPDTVNLGHPERAAAYARASLTVRMKRGEPPRELRGAPVLYGITIPSNPPYPEGADAFLQELLASEGQRILTRRGFRPLVPATCDPCEGLPPAVKVLVKSNQTGSSLPP